MNDSDDTTQTLAVAAEHPQQSPPITAPVTEPPAPLTTEQLPLTGFTAAHLNTSAIFNTETDPLPAPEPATSPATMDATPPATETATPPVTRPILQLTDYLTAHVPPTLRNAAYRIISDAVTAGKVAGLVHPSRAEMEVIGSTGKPASRSYPQVLLKNTPECAAQLETLCAAAARAEMIRTGGRHMTAKEIAEHADPAVFDALIVANRQRQAARKKRSAYELKRRKAKRRAS
jgi:hypothetical protein